MKRKINPIIISSIVVLVLGGTLLLPLNQAHAAGLPDLISEGIKNIVIGSIDIISIPLSLMFMLAQITTGFFAFIASEIMKATIAINETIPMIPSNAQDMVSVGWRFTRDLANMFFILILAWIGFANILRIEGYEVKKLLTRLIIIALLVNFIPVIAGVIIDISNIITHYFAFRSSSAGDWLVNKLPMNDVIRGGWEGLEQLEPGKGGLTAMATKSLMGVMFNMMAFIILTLYTGLFILRIVAIWVLIVLAPLAWVSYIIPQGKKMWDMWWKQFIQWAIIGIPMTFFLFLSGLVLQDTMACKTQSMDFEKYGFGTGVLADIGGTLLCSTLPFVAGVAILAIGFLLSINIAPKGADSIMKGAKKGSLVAGKMIGQQAWKGSAGTVKNFVKSPVTFFQAKRMGMSNKDALGEVGRDIKRWVRPKTSMAAPEATWRQTAGYATGNMWKAVKDSAKAGWIAGIGGKKKKKGKPSRKKGFILCPLCSQEIAADAERCLKCGTKLSD